MQVQAVKVRFLTSQKQQAEVPMHHAKQHKRGSPRVCPQTAEACSKIPNPKNLRNKKKYEDKRNKRPPGTSLKFAEGKSNPANHVYIYIYIYMWGVWI